MGEAPRKSERGDDAKSEFLSRMGHELRTPLNSIIGFAQLLEMEGLDGTQREYTERILEGSRHLLELINEVVDIFRIETGTLGVSIEPVNADGAIAEALDLIRPMASDRGLRIHPCVASSSGRWVAADQQRLKQMLLNLLSNAVKLNRDRGSLTVSLEQDAEWVRLLVSDTGPGLPPQQLERLFVPFERLMSEGGEVEGTGLGLALSKRLAEAMHGTLRVESRPGVGTTFSLALPAEKQPHPEHSPSPNGPRKGEEAMEGSRPQVLYIEDNVSNLQLIEEILSQRPQVKLVAAMQGRLGLELAEQHRPDLIVLDLHLPDIPGSEVLARLRSEEATRTIPVVVLSADATPGQIDRLLAGGAQAYLTKPLDIPRFLELVDEFTQPGGIRQAHAERAESWMHQR